MKKANRLVFFLLAAMLMICLAACGSEANNSQESEGVPETDGKRTITDSLGRKVEIPATVKTIVPLGNTPRMITYLGLADKVVGIGSCEIAESPVMAYAYINIDKWKDLPNVGTDAMGETSYYPETIIEANPDVILCTYGQDVVEDLERQIGLPVVAVAPSTLFDEDFNQSLRILGEVCHVSDRAEEIISFIDQCLNDLQRRTADIPDDKKPTVLAAAATFAGSHGIEGIYANYPVFKTIAAKDVAIGVTDKVGGVLVDKEKIIDWNPDMIFLDFSGVELVKNDYAENPDYYAQLKAVKNGNVYQWPNSTWHWSNVEIPLVSAYYLSFMLYPEAFSDIVFEEKAREIFEFFLGEENYLSTLESVGAGYGKVVLGE